jgi:hypothetical protein
LAGILPESESESSKKPGAGRETFDARRCFCYRSDVVELYGLLGHRGFGWGNVKAVLCQSGRSTAF